LKDTSHKLSTAIGWMAVFTPLTLILGGCLGGDICIGKSISSYYWSIASVIFIGLLTICGSFLIFYEGYAIKDKAKTTVVGIAMLGVVTFPCYSGSNYYLFVFIPPNITNIIHGVCATITFTLLGNICLTEFTKAKREIGIKVFKICGYTIYASLILIPLTSIGNLREITDSFRLFFILECIILEAFGIAWLTKGKVIFREKNWR
jgi:hypothetical protein